MSTLPNVHIPSDASRLPMTLPRLSEKKALGEPIVMVTAYDYPSALAVDTAGVDLVLVGDSGRDDRARLRQHRAGRARRAAHARQGRPPRLSTPFLVGDLPFGSYEVSDEQAVQTAFRFIKEAGCDAVKLEGGGPTSVARARAIAAAASR
jgi:3-methyl-2-oxobutanoate hydroxymethyltransferase